MSDVYAAHSAIIRVLNSLWLGDDLANSETQLIDVLAQAAQDIGAKWSRPNQAVDPRVIFSVDERHWLS